MIFDVVTIFPDFFSSIFAHGLLKRAGADVLVLDKEQFPRLKLWIDKTVYHPMKIEFGDASGKKLKTDILLWANGGASQIDTFDMKPGQPTGGPFRPINTSVTGLQVCEYLPRMARLADKFAVIRSMQTSEPDHPGGVKRGPPRRAVHRSDARPRPRFRCPRFG